MGTTTHTNRRTDLSPLGAYLRLRGKGPSFILESVARGRLGRYSFVGRGSQTVAFELAERQLQAGVPVVGYLGYDHVAGLEPVLLPDQGASFPESRFVVASELIRFDHGKGRYDVLAGDRDEVGELLRASRPRPVSPCRSPMPAGASETLRFPSRAEYEAWVRRAKKHIRAGDVLQIVLSLRAERRTAVSAVDLYRALRRINPSPYMFLIELGELALVGSSPETLVKLEGRRASVNPIAGTTPRGQGDADRLLASAKDRAEHIMLVDLARNDLARVCRPGSVLVDRFLEPERFSHVTHLVSEVTGEIRPGVTPFDASVLLPRGDGHRGSQGTSHAAHL